MNNIQWVAPDVAVLTKSGAVVTASGYSPYQMPVKDARDPAMHSGLLIEAYRPAGTGIEIAPWGANNLYPLWLLEMLRDSNINAQLIYTKISLAMGRIYAFRWDIDPETGREVRMPYAPPLEFRRMIRSEKMNDLLRARATDFFITGNAWMKIMLNRGGTRIEDFEHLDASTMRLGIRDPETKRISKHYACTDWRHPRYHQERISETTVRIYEAFDPASPLEYFESVHHAKLYWTGQPYYGIQPWHSGYNWITYGNRMPVWMSANINKAHNIKYHIEYPERYFDYLLNLQEDEQKKKKDEVFAHIDSLLSGPEKAQATFYSKIYADMQAGGMVGWKITPIPNDVKDDAYIEAFYASIQASTSSMGVDPSLANIQMDGKMPASGSEKRISFQIHEVMKNDEVRKIMLAPLRLLRDVNGYDPDMDFDFSVRNIVTLAEDKGGITPPVLPDDLDL